MSGEIVVESCGCGAIAVVESRWPSDVQRIIEGFRSEHAKCRENRTGAGVSE